MPSFDEVAVFDAADGNAGDTDGRAGRIVDAVEAPVHAGEIGFSEGDDGFDGNLRELRAHDVVEMQEFRGAVAITVAGVKNCSFCEDFGYSFAAALVPSFVEKAANEALILLQNGFDFAGH